MEPSLPKPEMTFSDAMKSSPQVGINAMSNPIIGQPIKMALYNSKGTQLGWLGVNKDGYAVLAADRRHSLTLEPCSENGTVNYRIKGSVRYMSVSNNYGYIGFYKSPTGFKLQGANLVSDYNGNKLSLYSEEDGYLYANDKYEVLDVTLEPVVKPVIPNPPLTDQIEHVVVLMMENRSFDNMLGGLYPEKTQQGLYRGLKGDETNPVDPNDPSKGTVKVFQGSDIHDTWIMPYPDPGELFDDMNEQIFGTKCPSPDTPASMQGFASNYRTQPGAPDHIDGPVVMPDPGNIMQYYTKEAVPITSYLAEQFAVCDGWFASGPVQTLSNRIFAHCGTPGLVPNTHNARINNPDFTKGWHLNHDFKPPISEKTIFELLDETYPGEINWKVYYHDAPVSALCDYVYENWSWWSSDSGNVFTFKEHFSSETNFEFDIKNNQLPKYSFIEPRYTDVFQDGNVNSAHPGGAGIDFHHPNKSSLPPPISVKDGEALLKEVYDILTKYPETFKKTLFVVIYDEHGGLYDHLPPPKATSPFTSSQKVENFAYDRYGVRIPAILINPGIPRGTIYPPREMADKLHFDHTSLISTVSAQFGLPPNLTPRSASAPKLEKLIPDIPEDHNRPASPAIPGLMEHTAVPSPVEVPMLDVAAAIAVLNQQDHPHALAYALTPLLSKEHIRRHKIGADLM